MHISHLAPLMLCLLPAHSSICFANPLFAAKKVPRSTLLTDPPLNDTTNAAEPTCTERGPISTTSPKNNLNTFSTDCIAAANIFFNAGIAARTSWHWKRRGPGQPPLPGYPSLPYAAAPWGCMLQLDVLDEADPDAEDTFALVQIEEDFRRLFAKCVRPNPRAPAGGFVPVGPRQVLKLSIAPTPITASLVEGGLVGGDTGLLNVVSRS